MMLYTFSAAPSCQRIELAIAEKGLDLPVTQIDIRQGEQFTPAYQAKNPACDVPMLELDDGTCISQVPAIALYLEEAYPHRPLYGTTAKQKAQVIMWEHLCNSQGQVAIGEILRNSASSMHNRALTGPHNYAQIPALAERGRQRVQNFFADLNQRLEHNDYIAGDYFSMADITAWVSCNFAGWVKEAIPAECGALQQWHRRLAARPAFTVR